MADRKRHGATDYGYPRNANAEYVIEKALIKMTQEIRTLSVALKTSGGKTQMGDTAHIFLADHQVPIQETLVPPYVQPFLMKRPSTETALSALF